MLTMDQTYLFHRGYSIGGGEHNQARSTGPGGPYQRALHRQL